MPLLILRSSAAPGGGGGGGAGTLTVNGSGFGSRSTLSPIKTAFMEDTEQGDSYLDAGFDFISLNWDNIPNADAYVDMVDGIAGGSYYTYARSGDERFWHYGHSVPSGINELYIAYWQKFDKEGTSGSGSLAQIKGARAGISTNYSDPNAQYAANPKMSWSAFCNAGSNGSGGITEARHHSDGGTEILTGGQTGNEPALFTSTWHYFEHHYKWNTAGVGDGIQRIWVDNILCQQKTDVNFSSSTREFRYVQYNPGMANDFANINTHVRISRVYLDRTRQHVALGNASTASACTGFIPLGLSHQDASWSDTQIIADAPASIPSGYDWAYVMSTSGTRNSSGLSYTVN